MTKKLAAKRMSYPRAERDMARLLESLPMSDEQRNAIGILDALCLQIERRLGHADKRNTKAPQKSTFVKTEAYPHTATNLLIAALLVAPFVAMPFL